MAEASEEVVGLPADSETADESSIQNQEESAGATVQPLEKEEEVDSMVETPRDGEEVVKETPRSEADDANQSSHSMAEEEVPTLENTPRAEEPVKPQEDNAGKTNPNDGVQGTGSVTGSTEVNREGCAGSPITDERPPKSVQHAPQGGMSPTSRGGMSPTSRRSSNKSFTSSKGGKSKKRNITLFTFDETAREPPYLTSPRSLQACASQGILPEELLYKPPQAYGDKDTAERILKLRYDHFEPKRQSKLSACKKTYDALLRRKGKPRESNVGQLDAGRGPSSYSYTDTSHDDEEKTMEKMRRQMAAMKLKQREEVENLLMAELRAQRLRELGEEKQAAQRARDEAMEREKARRTEEWERMKEERDRKRKEEEQEVERERRRVMQAAFEKEKAQRDRATEEEKMRREEAQKREHEKLHKSEEQRRRTEQIFAEKERLAQERHAVMQEKENQRRAALEEKRAMYAAINEKKRQETEARVQATLAAQQAGRAEAERQFQEKERKSEEKRLQFQNQRKEAHEEMQRQVQQKNEHIKRTMDQMYQREEEKKQMLIRREQEAEERLRQLTAEKQLNEQQRRRESEEKEAKRQMAVQRAIDDEERRKRELLLKQQQEAETMQRVLEEKRAEGAYRLEMEHLKKQDKVEAVERLRRIEEFRKGEQLQRIEKDSHKAYELRLRREEMQQEKLRMKKELELQKQAIQSAVDSMKRCGRWEPPPGVDLHVDIEQLKHQVNHQLAHRVNSKQNQQLRRRTQTAGSGYDAQPPPEGTMSEQQYTQQGERQAARMSEEAEERRYDSDEFETDVEPSVLPAGRGIVSEEGRDDSQSIAEEMEADQSVSSTPRQPHPPSSARSNPSAGPTPRLHSAREDHARQDDPDVGQHSAQPARSNPGSARVKIAEGSDGYNGGANGYNGGGHSGEEAGNRSASTRVAVSVPYKPEMVPNGGQYAEDNVRNNGGYESGQGTYPAVDPRTGRSVGPGVRKKRRGPRREGLRRETKEAYDRMNNGGGVRGRINAVMAAQPTMHMGLHIVDELRRQQNEHLLGILEEEQSREAEREILLRQVPDSAHRERLEKTFALERAQASERIMKVTAEHEMVLLAKIQQLGIE